MEVLGNIKYVTGVTEYVVSGEYGIINVDTSVNAVNIILPNILNGGYYGTNKGFIINDISDNASVNNITIVAADNTVNSASSVVVNQNGGTAKCSIASQTEWFIVREPESVATPSYKVYTALLTQSGTDAPVATVLENTLGGTVVWTYGDIGEYHGTLSGMFIADKTFCVIDKSRSGGREFSLYRNGDSAVKLVTEIFTAVTPQFTASNGVLNKTSIEIRVYN